VHERGVVRLWEVARCSFLLHRNLMKICMRVCVCVPFTDGTFWHPMVSKSDKLYAFNSDLCRSVYFTCDGTVSVVAGVSTYHFSVPASVMASPHDNPDNRGFCTPASDNCTLLAGVLNVTRCRGNDSHRHSPYISFWLRLRKYKKTCK